MKRMLFNATHPEELRVAIVDGQKLLDLDIEAAARSQKKGNIYKGVVTRVEPSLEAAFVDYGSERQGFLPLKEISRSYFLNYDPSTPMAQVRIQDILEEKQELIVQVEKEERGTKGAALTTFISLAGRFLVLMPNNPKGGGISRRIEGEDRSELRGSMEQLEFPVEHALIARTAGIGKSVEELQWDLDYLLQLWKAIDSAATERAAAFLIYQESNLVVRAIRDYLRSDIAEIVIDDAEIFQRATKFMEQVMPQNVARLKVYEDSVPLFSRFQIEHQIEGAYSREVQLPAGGAIVIDHTEAVVTIDVNSARSTKGADIEETALATNLEAVDEIARQLRIRDMGGLIVIDLIDMTAQRNQRTVEKRLNEALKTDRARVQVGRISRFGLLEMSRQRLRASLGEANYQVCPRCDGAGHIRSVSSSGLSILRILEEEALKENTAAIHAHLPTETATFLLNEKRHEVNLIETRLATRVIIIPTPNLESPHFQIDRVRSEDLSDAPEVMSYQMKSPGSATEYKPASARATRTEAPSIGHNDLPAPRPIPVPQTEVSEPKKEGSKSLLQRLWGSLTGTEPAAEPTSAPPPAGRDTSSSRDPSSRKNSSRQDPRRRGRGASTSRRQSGDGTQRSGQTQSRSRNRRSRGRGGNQSTNRSERSPQGSSQGSSQRSPQGSSAKSPQGRASSGRQRDQSRRASSSAAGQSGPPATGSEPVEVKQAAANQAGQTDSTVTEASEPKSAAS